MSDGPKKYDTEPTMPSVRTRALAPVAIREAFVATLEPSNEERVAILDAMQSAERDALTLVSCPACEGCDFCHGSHMVEPVRAAAFRAETVPVSEDK